MPNVLQQSRQWMGTRKIVSRMSRARR